MRSFSTSCLDGETDAAVMAALSGTRMLMLTARRLTNLAGPDAVHVMDETRLIASGPPDIVLPRTTVEPARSIVGLRMRDGAAAMQDRMAYPACRSGSPPVNTVSRYSGPCSWPAEP